MNYNYNNNIIMTRQSQDIFTLSAKLIFDPFVMYFTENFNVARVSGVNVCPVFKFGFHIPVIVLKITLE